ncbi:hypothetical protein CAPN004_17740 [Capnocytophaga cynodegmi]|uniref:hypothetical protein n=1 Tax=Capnocytophaga cynodegmi TaxID=28189 RepID=UPI001ACF4E86|nr:hypothetical protein [Capnocytophaga cynodegmi]GIM52744.1 hypothetical protein CAPN004_17740 [Capnocytophaga cynodegmi]
MKKNHTPTIKEFKNSEIIEVATDANTQISLQVCRTHTNGVFSHYSLGLVLTDLLGENTAEMATFLTLEQTKDLIKKLTALSVRIENLNKLKNN